MKKQRIYILALCCLLICGFAACGRDKNGTNNNSVTGGNNGTTTVTPLPTKTPTQVPTVVPDNTTNGHDTDGDGILDRIEDTGEGVINGAGDVINGVGNAVEDIGNGLMGEDTNGNHNTNGTDMNQR